MTLTPLTNWVRLTGQTIDGFLDLDPRDELELDNEQREAMLKEAKDRLVTEADKILAPYGAQLLPDGGVYIDLNAEDPLEWDDAALEDFKERISMIEYDDIQEKYGELTRG